MDATYSTIEVRRLTSALGAEIRGVDLSRPLGQQQFAEVHQAFLDNLVIFFPGQHLTHDQHKDFARRFGTLNVHPFVEAVPGHPEILEVIKDVDDSWNFGGVWHSDLTFLEQPPLGAVLYAREVPEFGGDTLWSNLYLAYETLSDTMRRMIDPLTAIHSAVDVYGPSGAVDKEGRKGSMRMAETTEALAEVEHPLVRTHPETGRKFLFVAGGYLRRIKGMKPAESQALLDFLNAHASREEFTCRFRWSADTVAMWDNRCTLHYALNDYHGQRRLMYRIAINGDRPY